MKIKIALSVALAMLTCAAVAEAAGVFDTPQGQRDLMQRERALTQEAREGQAGISRVRRGPRGARGPKGATGAAGPAGPAGAISSVTQVSGPEVFMCGFEFECSIQAAHAECPPGTRVISGGWAGVFFGTTFFSFAAGNGWSVGVANEGELSARFHAVADCAS